MELVRYRRVRPAITVLPVLVLRRLALVEQVIIACLPQLAAVALEGKQQQQTQAAVEAGAWLTMPVPGPAVRRELVQTVTAAAVAADQAQRLLVHSLRAAVPVVLAVPVVF